jgi:4-hydroxy-3-methylbut-2-enyl diphosphate reductase
MKIIRAQHLGMCFGVREAIELALNVAREQPLTVLGDLVHNETVLEDLKAHGVRIVQQAAEARTETVMITAHGASERAIRGALDRGLKVLEATCPLVRVAHRAITRLAADGYHPVIIGKRGHVEVRGLTEDLPEYDIILKEADVFEMSERPRFGVAAQTTQPIERVRGLVELIRWAFPRAEVRFVDTVCHPTKQRQMSALQLARESDVVVVVGGEQSNNTRELVESCRQYCDRVFHVQTAKDLQRNWFVEVDTVGITAGTSTPDPVIEEVERWLRNLTQELEPARSLEAQLEAA